MAPIVKPQPEIVWSLRANSRVTIPILLAIGGLLYGIAVITSWNGQFHGLTLEKKREVVQNLLYGRNTFLQAEIKRLDSVAGRRAPDSAARRDTLNKYLAAQKQVAIDTVNLANFNTDTSLSFYARFLSVDRDSLLDAIQHGKGQTPLTVQAKDTCCAPYPRNFVATASLEIHRDPKSLVEFFDRNPLFGFWFVLSIAQMSMWFMLAALVIGTAMSTNDIEPAFQYNLKNGVLCTLMPLAVVAIFAYVINIKLVKGPVINETFFLEKFNFRMYFYSIPGYFVATLGFGVYTFLANKLEMLNTTATKPGADLAAFKTEYLRLKSDFTFVFNCSAVILSVYVTWLGVLFSAVNNLEAARFYYLCSGKQLLNYDFVYLMGIIHSLLLAIFYFPVRLQFNSLELTVDDKTGDTAATSMTKVFKSFSDIIGGILLTASPLITTVVQKGLAGLLGS
jgi:hypothetical protein